MTQSDSDISDYIDIIERGINELAHEVNTAVRSDFPDCDEDVDAVLRILANIISGVHDNPNEALYQLVQVNNELLVGQRCKCSDLRNHALLTRIAQAFSVFNTQVCERSVAHASKETGIPEEIIVQMLEWKHLNDGH